MSSSDLKDMAKQQQQQQQQPQRPTKAMRRRSTRVYHLGALEDSVVRQKRWEEIVESRLVDVFFSVHSSRRGDPLYISEQLFETMVSAPLMSACVDENANFAGFDLLDGDDDTLRLNSCVVRVYAKSHSSPDYSLLIEYDVALCFLQFIGNDVTPRPLTSNRVDTDVLEIANFHHPFPSNSVILQLTDGYYTAFNDVVTHNHSPPIISDVTSKVSPNPRPCVYSNSYKRHVPTLPSSNS
jgi:hypothetical protein